MIEGLDENLDSPQHIGRTGLNHGKSVIFEQGTFGQSAWRYASLNRKVQFLNVQGSRSLFPLLSALSHWSEDAFLVCAVEGLRSTRLSAGKSLAALVRAFNSQ